MCIYVLRANFGSQLLLFAQIIAIEQHFMVGKMMFHLTFTIDIGFVS